jgi:DNA processing protein
LNIMGIGFGVPGDMQLGAQNWGPAISPISPKRELGAYEALWLQPKATWKSIAEKFEGDPSALPSDFIPDTKAFDCAQRTFAMLKAAGVSRFGVRINHAGDYPHKLRDAKHPVELLYFQGEWELSETRCVAVVGSRKTSEDGLKRTKQLCAALVDAGFTIVSGLAQGVDRIAHETAIEQGGRTIGVIGTPLGVCYPAENSDLQNKIAKNYLLISQVPVLRYSVQKIAQNKLFFPERNATMSALTEGTIIVEAGETSGTLTQARAALHQGRRLFILESCFQRTDITWPSRFEGSGAIRVRKMSDILDALERPSAA